MPGSDRAEADDEAQQPLLDEGPTEMTPEQIAERKQLSTKAFNKSIIFFLVTMSMNQMNITLIIAISESISKRNHQPLFMSGLMVGLVGLGGICGLFPYTLYFQKHNFKLGYVIHALCALIGGLVSLYGTEYHWIPGIYIGRVVLGFSDSVNTLSYFAIHTLVPFEQKTMWLLLCNVMSGLGCAAGPFMSSILTKYADGVHGLHMRHNDGLPIVVTVVYAIIMLFSVIFLFPSDKEMRAAGLYDQTMNNKRIPESGGGLSYDESVKRGALTASVVLFVTFTRTCIRFCWETGAMSVLMFNYNLQEKAGYIVGGIIAILPLYSLTVSMLSRRVSDHTLLTCLETCEILGAVLLFRFAPNMPTLWMCLFVFGSLLLYYNNSGQSGLLSSVMLKNSVPGHKYLDSVSLLAIYNCCAMCGVMCGPLISRAVLQIAYTQNTLAICIAVLCVIQTSVIAFYFCSIKEKVPNKAIPDIPEQENRIDVKAKAL